MDTLINLLPVIISGLMSGGLVAIFTLPEKKVSAKLDNAERLVSKYEDILKRYEKRISELESEVKQLRLEGEKKDLRIGELETKLSAMETKRNSKGQFMKRERHDITK